MQANATESRQRDITFRPHTRPLFTPQLYLHFSLFLADRTNGRAIGTVLRLSVCLSVVCDVMYCD